jgi:hypothetical protein
MRQQRYVLALPSLALLAALLNGPTSAFTSSYNRRMGSATSDASVRMLMAVNKGLEENESSGSSSDAASLSSSSSGSSADDDDNDDSLLVTSRNPHQLKNKRGTFLGFRNAKDVPGWTEMRAKSYAGEVRLAALQAAAASGTKLQSSVQPLMPDGGLSPCVIRVLGVGGGGCNAVSTTNDHRGSSNVQVQGTGCVGVMCVPVF